MSEQREHSGLSASCITDPGAATGTRRYTGTTDATAQYQTPATTGKSPTCRSPCRRLSADNPAHWQGSPGSRGSDPRPTSRRHRASFSTSTWTPNCRDPHNEPRDRGHGRELRHRSRTPTATRATAIAVITGSQAPAGTTTQTYPETGAGRPQASSAATPNHLRATPACARCRATGRGTSPRYASLGRRTIYSTTPLLRMPWIPRGYPQGILNTPRPVWTPIR